MGKKILLSFASIFLVWQSYELLRNIDKIEISNWLSIIFVAWLINMFVTGVFAFSGFAFPTQRILPSRYYKINKPSKLKVFYKVLKVDLFRQALLATLWKSQKQRKNYFNGRKNGIANLEEQSKKSEFGHLVPFVLIFFLSIYLFSLGLVKLSLSTFFINIIGNLYPVILQRHHRMRIQIIKRRAAARNA